MIARRSAFLLLLILTGAVGGLTNCAGGPSALRLAAPSKVTRSQVMGKAIRYASHSWTARGINVRHGPDGAGIRVDTPDQGYQKPGAVPGYWVPGQVNQGVPYQWGGFSTPEEFDRGLAAGLAAGDVYTDEKRRLLSDGVSREAVGIDCSGFVSRCWDLPKAFSTRELATICEPLPSWDGLKPGDALNIHNVHVLLFCGWVDPARHFIAAYETGGPPDWKVIRHVIGVDFLKRKGYRPLRYQGIREG